MYTFIAVCEFQYTKFSYESGNGSPRTWKQIHDPDYSEEILETVTREVKFSAEHKSFDYMEDILKQKLARIRKFDSYLELNTIYYPSGFVVKPYDGWHLGYFDLYKLNTVTMAYERVFRDNIPNI